MKDLGITIDNKYNNLISKASVNFILYHSLLGRQLWSPLRYSNGVMFYGNQEYKETFLKSMKLANKYSSMVEVNRYTFNNETDGPTNSRTFKTFAVSSNFESFIDELILVRGRIREDNSNFFDINRKISILLLDLTPHELSQLNKIDLKNKFITLLKEAHKERIYIFIMAQLAEQLSSEIVSLIEWESYLGKENMDYCDNIYSELPHEVYNSNRELVGFLKNQNNEVLIPLHDKVYKPSQYKIDSIEVAIKQEEIYEEFLSLID